MIHHRQARPTFLPNAGRDSWAGKAWTPVDQRRFLVITRAWRTGDAIFIHWDRRFNVSVCAVGIGSAGNWSQQYADTGGNAGCRQLFAAVLAWHPTGPDNLFRSPHVAQK